jgi:hypothetical protein
MWTASQGAATAKLIQSRNRACASRGTFCTFVCAPSQVNLQTAVFTLQNTAQSFGMEISPEKSETMAFLGQDPLRFKILWITEVYNLKYLDREISSQNEKDMQQKLAKFSQIMGTLKQQF